jgi:hypothetical protein
MKPNQRRNQSEISKSTHELDAVKASIIVSLELDDLAGLLEGGLGHGPEDLGVLEMSEVVGGLEEQKLFHAEGRLLVMVLREVGRAQLQPRLCVVVVCIQICRQRGDHPRVVSLDLLDGDDTLGAGLFQRKHGGSAFKAGPNAPPNIAEKEVYHIGLILGKDGVVDLVGFRELSLGLEPHSEETLDAGGLLEALLEVGQAYLCDMRGEEVRGGRGGRRGSVVCRAVWKTPVVAYM